MIKTNWQIFAAVSGVQVAPNDTTEKVCLAPCAAFISLLPFGLIYIKGIG